MVKSYPPFMKFEAFIDRFLDSLELTPLVNKVSLEDVEIGTTEAQHFQEAIIEFLDWWVGQIDQLLSHEEPGSDGYISLMDKRFFTFREFQKLFEYTNENWYRDYPAFEYLMIADERQKERYISKVSNSFEDYFTILQNSSKVPFSSFFF